MKLIRKKEETRGAVSDGSKNEEERHQPGWIQRYLDLADLIIRRGRRKEEPRPTHSKAA